ncbi:MAG: hypothetical protein QOE44_3210 [Solirubrobacteraceae bacterium]|nr:hypothetical protein [Solirubrobacteraceae bacterium]
MRRGNRTGRASALGWAGAGLVVLGGCGGAGPAASPCPPAAAGLLAAAVGPGARVDARAGSGEDPTIRTCVLRAGGARVTATIDTAPQAYFRLERTVVEEAQTFAQTQGGAAPVQVPGLGLDADWLPGESRLVTTDGTRLVTIAVDWPGAARGRKVSLAAGIARTLLGRLRPDVAQPGAA